MIPLTQPATETQAPAWFLALLLLLSTLTQAQPATPPTNPRDELRFRNGDLLFGSLLSISPTPGVSWQHPDSSEPITFTGPGIADILLAPRPYERHLTNSFRVQLANRDLLEGRVLSLDPTNLVLETDFAGRLTIPRTRVDTLTPLDPKRRILFEGPTGTNDWTFGKVVSAVADPGIWSFEDGAFVATKAASIARDVHLPEIAAIHFDVAWKGLLYMAVALYTDYLQPVNLAGKDQEPDFGGFYSLQLNTYSANLLSVKKQDPIKYLGQIGVNAFNQKNSAHIEIRAHKAKRTIALLVDGTLIKQWADNDLFAGRGTGVRFVHQGQGSIRLTNLRVTDWDGQFEESRSHPTDTTTDLAKLRNGDRILGQIERLTDSNLVITPASGAKLVVPLNRVKQLELSLANAGNTANQPADTRATFRGGGSLTFQLERFDPASLTISSPNFGHATLHPGALERLSFGPKAFPTPAKP